MTVKMALYELRDLLMVRRTAAGLCALVLFAIAGVLSLAPMGEQQFSYLAQSFLQGKLYFLQAPGSWADTALFEGMHYWPLGPFPALLLMPFVFMSDALGIFFFQGYLLFPITVGVFILWYCIARTFSFSERDALLLALTFVFGSGYILAALFPWSWYFAHAVTVLFMSLALYEYFTRKRYALIGVLMAAVVMTRMTAGIGALFFMLAILFLSRKSWKEKRHELLVFCFPIFAAGLLLGAYNFARFGDFFEQGYALQLLAFEPLARAREYGIIALAHVPANLYYLFFALPLPVLRDGVSHVLSFPFLKPDPWGMSIGVTSPYLMVVFFRYYKSRLTHIALVSVLAIAIPLLLYYGVGYRQYGYRYALDFFPLLYLSFLIVSARTSPSLSQGMHRVLWGSVAVNGYLFFSFYLFS